MLQQDIKIQYLLLPIQHGNPEKFGLLLDYGDNYNLVCHGKSPSQYATVSGNRPEICKLLMQADEEFLLNDLLNSLK